MSERCKRYCLVKKLNEFIVNFRQYFSLKVGVIEQIGGRIWAGNQYNKTYFQDIHLTMDYCAGNHTTDI